MTKHTISLYMAEIGRKGGLKTLKKHGKKHFQAMRAKSVKKVIHRKMS